MVAKRKPSIFHSWPICRSSISHPPFSIFNRLQPAQEKQNGSGDPKGLKHVDFRGHGLIQPKKGHGQDERGD